jgi:ankyrin repeat protein
MNSGPHPFNPFNPWLKIFFCAFLWLSLCGFRQGLDSNVDGSTALHWAVYRNDLELTDTLIRAGAKVSAATREGITPLYMASVYGNPAIIDKLLKAGANANERGPNGETTLMLAAHNGNAEAVQRLIAAGADVNAVEQIRGTTALMWAVARKNVDAVRVLLDAKADVNARSGAAGVPRIPRLSPAVNIANVRSAQQRLLAQVAGTAQPGAGQRDLGATAAGGQRGAAAQDDDDTPAGAAVAGGDGGMLTALIFAAREGDLESAKLLLAAGADVNQVTQFGWTPLLTATHNRNYQLAKFLIDKGADVNIANKGGWMPLYLATDNRNIESGDYPWPKPDMDHLEFIKILLDRGANPNARNQSATLNRTVFNDQWFNEPGATAFVRASQSSDIELMRLLLAYGADPAIPTAFGDTALSAAAGIGWVEGVTYEWSQKNNLEAIKLLLGLGLNPNVTNRDGRTPLMGAALKGRNDVVRTLVDAGAKLETRDYGSRDTDKAGSVLAGHTWQAIDYAEGLVRTGVQSAPVHPETAALLRELMVKKGLPVPDPNRTLDSICIVVLCKGDLLPAENQR